METATVAVDSDWRCWMNIESVIRDSSQVLEQLFRYAVSGIVCNIAGYCLYLLLTYSGLTPKLTVTFLYPVGVVAGFFANRNFTFRDDGHIGVTSVRFILAHALGYLINLAMLALFVDKLKFAHQFVQLAAVGVVAIYLFIVFRVFVFPGTRSSRKEE